MSEIPMKIEAVQFICSGCGKRSLSAVVNDTMKCKNCKARYIRSNGEWKWSGNKPDKSHESAFNSGDLMDAMCGGNRIPQRGKL